MRMGRNCLVALRKAARRSLRSPWGAAQGRVRPGSRPAGRVSQMHLLMAVPVAAWPRGSIIDHGVLDTTLTRPQHNNTTQVQLTSPAYCGPRGVLESTTSTVHGHRVHAVIVLYDTLLVNAGERLLVAMPNKVRGRTRTTAHTQDLSPSACRSALFTHDPFHLFGCSSLFLAAAAIDRQAARYAATASVLPALSLPALRCPLPTRTLGAWVGTRWAPISCDLALPRSTGCTISCTVPSRALTI